MMYKVELETLLRKLVSDAQLCAKWQKRKGVIAAKLRKVMGMSPKTYRKTVVHLTTVVEQNMCAGDWDAIEFDKLPSIASKQYQKAFGRHTPDRYASYIKALTKGEAKINAGAIFPHDVVSGLRYGVSEVADAQWKALPNYMGDVRMLPMCDVSGSMNRMIGSGNVNAMQVSIALGMYISEKNPGVFNGLISTFSEKPALMTLSGSLKERYNQLETANWGMNTNLSAAFTMILDKAVTHNVPANEMPEYLVILSDMQFDACTKGTSALKMIEIQYAAAGYEMPKIVFWNLAGDTKNVPVASKQTGAMLISGFSPAILQSVLSAKSITPYDVMLNTVNVERYDLNVWQ